MLLERKIKSSYNDEYCVSVVNRRVCEKKSQRQQFQRRFSSRFDCVWVSKYILYSQWRSLRIHKARVLRRAYDGLLSLDRTVIGYPPTFRVNASFIFIRMSDSLMCVCTLKLRNTSEIISFIDIIAYFIPIDLCTEQTN